MLERKIRLLCSFFCILAYFSYSMIKRTSGQLIREFLRMLQWLFSCLKADSSKLNSPIEFSQFKDEGRKARKHSNSSTNLSPPRCNGCKTDVGDGMSCVDAFDALWHPQCLCCLHCHEPIALHQIYRKKLFHKPCYKKHFRPNCHVCDKKIPRTNKGKKYYEHPFWKEKYCPSHEDDGTARCCSCERLESCRTTYVMLEDGRRLCRECMESAITNTDECIPLHIEIREFFRGLHMAVDKKFPLLLVKKEALNKVGKFLQHKLDNQREVVTRGVCLSEGQNVTSIAKRPVIRPNNQPIDMVRENQRVSGFDVTAILILYGLPRLLTGYILAHEMMHAWLRINGYQKLNMILEEGICQVLAHMWLESQTYPTLDASSSSHTPPLAATATSKKSYQSDFEKRFTEFCKYQIETDDSPVYGLGFKKVYKMMLSNHHNIKDTLNDIVRASKTTPATKI